MPTINLALTSGGLAGEDIDDGPGFWGNPMRSV